MRVCSSVSRESVSHMLPHTERRTYGKKGPSADQNLQEDARHNANDAATVIAVILPAVITSILFAFKGYFHIPSSIEVLKLLQSDWCKREGEKH